MGRYRFQKQLDSVDCGPSCLKMICGHYGMDHALEDLRELCHMNRDGVSLPNIDHAARSLGFSTAMAKLSLRQLSEDCPLPAILHWTQDHYVVLYNIKLRKGLFNGKNDPSYVVADPAHGVVRLGQKAFMEGWDSGDGVGVVLAMETTQAFYANRPAARKGSMRYILGYLAPYKRYLFQIALGMLATSVLSFVFPFITQLLVDGGLSERNVPLIYLLFSAQVFLFLGNSVFELLRGWLLLHLNARISLAIVSDFLAKLLRLPLKFFDTKTIGDLSQRINDHHRIEGFLTGSLLGSLFSVWNIVVFLLVLGYYDLKIVAIFLMMSALSLGWVFFFQARRKRLNYERFSRDRDNQDKLFELVSGMQEVKLFGAERTYREAWEKLQLRSFNLSISSLTLEQTQQYGYLFLSHLKNVLITFACVLAVLDGKITIGAMLSISYIVGQTNSPIEQLIAFIKGAQDARLSMERLVEIHHKAPELDRRNSAVTDVDYRDIVLKDVCFQYEGPASAMVLRDLSISIPWGKTTAIVGNSGGGKTTLMKLLLKFYDPTTGSVEIGGEGLEGISPVFWRERCGTVMQDGYIFNDSIRNNIVMREPEQADEGRLAQAIEIANLQEFISGLPSGLNTRIGAGGMGLSGGQRQRILIARAVYKDPDFIFFDEATSSLDANNERIIVERLHRFLKGKTVVVIAHRLSTVQHADQIIMLGNGRVLETGNHYSLCERRGKYFELVKNQLQLS